MMRYDSTAPVPYTAMTTSSITAEVGPKTCARSAAYVGQLRRRAATMRMYEVSLAQKAPSINRKQPPRKPTLRNMDGIARTPPPTAVETSVKMEVRTPPPSSGLNARETKPCSMGGSRVKRSSASRGECSAVHRAERARLRPDCSGEAAGDAHCWYRPAMGVPIGRRTARLE